MSKFPTKPQRGQKALQAIYNSVCQIIDYLPTLEVRGDNKTISVSHSTAGTTIHANKNFAVTEGGRKYEAGSGLTLSGNVFNNALTSGQFIQITTGFAINCTLTGGNYIEITPGGVINYTGPSGGSGGGTSYFADGFTLSTTSPTGNTFCVYDVLPLITGAGGTVVSRYGDAPLYPGYALGTVITTPVYAGASGIGIIDDSTPGSYIKYICITGDVLTDSFYTFMDGLSSYPVYDANNNLIGKNVGIVQGYRNDLNTITGRPSTGNYILSSSGGTLSWAENNGGGGTPPAPPTAYYADNFTLSTTTENGTTFCMYDVLPLLTGGGGITVAAYGDAPSYPYNAKGTIISCPVYLPSTGIAIVDDSTEGTYNKYIAITGSFLDSSYYNFKNGLSSYFVYDNSNNVIGQDVGIVEAYRNDLNVLTGRPSTGNKILSSHAGTMSWEDPPTYTPSDPPTAYYADNITLSTVNGDGTTFFLLDVYPLLTGGGGVTVSYYGDAPGYLGASGTIISTPVYLPSTGIAIVDDETEGSYNKYISITGSFIDSAYYNFTNGLSAYNVLDANNNVIGQNVGIVEGYRNDLDVITGRGANKVLSSNAQSGLVWADNVRGVPAPSANRILSANSQGQMTWATNTAGGGGAEYTGIDPIVVNNSTHTISFNGSSMGVPWPNYASLYNEAYSSRIDVHSSYVAGPAGGWLRVSYKGNPTSNGGSDPYCYGVNIDDRAVGLYTLHEGVGVFGCTWLLPIPPYSRFFVNFPEGPTHAYFDGSTVQQAELTENYATISGIADSANSELYYAKQSYNSAKENAAYSKQQWDDYLSAHQQWEDEGEIGDEPEPDDAESYYYWWNDVDDNYREVVYHTNQIQYFITAAEEQYETMQQQGTDTQDVASWYVQKTYSYYNEATQYVTKAQAEVNKAHRYYLSACNYWGVTPQDLPNKDE